MKITKVDVLLISEKLKTPWTLGLGTAKKRDEIIVLVHTDEGITGIGSSYHAMSPHAIKAIIVSRLAPMVVGQNPLQIRTLWEKMFFGTHHLGSAAAQAIAGVDIALWDILGKATKQPVYRLLGGGNNAEDRGPRLATYVGCQTLGIRDDLDSLAAEACKYVQQGFKAIKLRGGAGVKTDLRTVGVVRKAVGDDIEIMIDANARYSWPEAVLLSKGLEKYNVFWLEDPFDFSVAYHKDEMARLRNLSYTPIASGGNVFTRFDFRLLAERGGVDFLTTEVVKSAGLSEATNIAAMAGALNIIVAPHTYNGVGQIAGLHFAAALPAHIRGHVEWDAGDHNAFRDELVVPAAVVKDGYVEVPNGPGLGLELNQEVLDRLAFIEGPEILGVPRERIWAPKA